MATETSQVFDWNPAGILALTSTEHLRKMLDDILEELERRGLSGTLAAQGETTAAKPSPAPTGVPKTDEPYVDASGHALEKRCVYCWGTGQIVTYGLHEGGEQHGCDACDGRGWVLTQQGYRLVAFLRRHGLVALTVQEAGS